MSPLFYVVGSDGLELQCHRRGRAHGLDRHQAARELVEEILDGGKEAFKRGRGKYGF